MAKNGWKLSKVLPGVPGRFWPKTGESGGWPIRYGQQHSLPLLFPGIPVFGQKSTGCSRLRPLPINLLLNYIDYLSGDASGRKTIEAIMPRRPILFEGFMVRMEDTREDCRRASNLETSGGRMEAAKRVCVVCVCMCVCVFFLIYSGRQACGHTSRGPHRHVHYSRSTAQEYVERDTAVKMRQLHHVGGIQGTRPTV